jgi:hypothetical protein
MYVTILDYSEGKVYAIKVPDTTDIEAYVDKHYGLSNTSYMITDQLNLEVTYI